MLGDDLAVLQQLHSAGNAAHLDRLPDQLEGNAVLAALESHQSVDADPAVDHDIERNRQWVGQGCENPLLRVPGFRSRRARRWAAAMSPADSDLLVGPGLQLAQRGKAPPVRIDAVTLVTNAALDLSLGLWLSWRTGVDVELQRPGQGSVGRVDHTPRTGTLRDRRFLVVDPHRRRHSAEALEAAEMTRDPSQHVLAARPDDRLGPHCQ